GSGGDMGRDLFQRSGRAGIGAARQAALRTHPLRRGARVALEWSDVRLERAAYSLSPLPLWERVAPNEVRRRVMRVGELNLRVPMTQDAERISKPLDVLAFWRAAGPDKWFERDDGFDADVRARFLATCAAAAQGRLDDWQGTPDGVLALLILLDQFPRNLFRDDARAFATDAQAREIAERAIARGFDRMFGLPERRFFYTPLMHSENLADQERCIALCRAAGDVEGVKYAELHADVIRRFGRFPHRN